MKKVVCVVLTMTILFSVMQLGKISVRSTHHFWYMNEIFIVDDNSFEVWGYGHGLSYVRLRDIAYILNGTSMQFDILDYGRENFRISRGEPYTPIGIELSPIINGARFLMSSSGFIIERFVDFVGVESFQTIPIIVDGVGFPISVFYDGRGEYFFELWNLSRILGFSTEFAWNLYPELATNTITAGTAIQTSYINVEAVYESVNILVNRERIEFQMLSPRQHRSGKFFRLRDIAYALNDTSAQFSVDWNSENNVIELTNSQPYVPIGSEFTNTGITAGIATPTIATVFIDHMEVSLSAYHINGYNYFMLQELVAFLNFEVSWYFVEPGDIMSITTN